MANPDRMRIGDTNRDSALAALAEHFAEQRLNPTEYRQRRALVPTARERGELRALFEDLPAPHPNLTPVKRASGPISGVWWLGMLMALCGIPAALAALVTSGSWWWLPIAIVTSWFLMRLGNGIEREKKRENHESDQPNQAG